jgi:hypothetical protein
VLGSNGLEVSGQTGLGDGRQHRDPVLVALAAADHDLVGGEVNVLDAEPAALEHAEAGAVEQAGHETRHAVEPLEQGTDLIAGKDDGQPLRALGAHDAGEPGKVDLQHVAVQEPEGAQGLVLGRGRDVAVHTANEVRKRVTPGAPISTGWRRS